ncbi:MAG: DNA-processing protein DprA [Oscillospiraceae bacterium]|nr:DNA-processing protein DprA [Oscillospiraceae bacterium]
MDNLGREPIREDDRMFWVWLHTRKGMSGPRLRALIRKLGTAREAWSVGPEAADSLAGGGGRLTAGLREGREMGCMERYMERLADMGVMAVIPGDACYPEMLAAIPDSPMALFIKGDPGFHRPSVSIVGTRRPTPYGTDMTDRFARELASMGFTVTSGLARGVDSHAHGGALKAGGATNAVLGCGPNVCYPPENRRLMREIEERGATITEYGLDVEPDSANFPARNRIISGLSLGLLVTEAGYRSGASITVGYAAEQGREVFALPGNVTSAMSRGTNQFIREGARLVTCVGELIEGLPLYSLEEGEMPGDADGGRDADETAVGARPEGAPGDGRRPGGDAERAGARTGGAVGAGTGSGSGVGLGPGAERIVDALSKGPAHIDRLAEETGTPIGLLASELLALELCGTVRQGAGKVFTLA